MNLSVRVLASADLAPMVAVEGESFPTEPWSEPMLRAQLNRADGISLGLPSEADGGQVLAAVALGWATAGVAELLRIAVSPPLRRKGSGRSLLRGFLDEALRRGAEEIWLEVRADNEAALGLYRAAGFDETGRRHRYYADGVDAVLMTALKQRLSG